MFSEMSSAEMRVVFARERCVSPVPSTLHSRLTNKVASAKIDNLVIDRIRRKKKKSARIAFVWTMGIYTYVTYAHGTMAENIYNIIYISTMHGAIRKIVID